MTIKMNHRGYELNYNTETRAITGETYPVKKWIASYCDAKWDPIRKAWIAQHDILGYTGVKEAIAYAVKKDELSAAAQSATQPTTDTNAQSEPGIDIEAVKSIARANHHNRPCPRCGTYCYGDCTAAAGY